LLLNWSLYLFFYVTILVLSSKMCIWNNQKVSFEIRNPLLFRRLRCACQIRIQKVRRMFLKTNILENTCLICNYQRIERELQIFCRFSIINNQIEQLAEYYSNFLFLFMPSCNIFWNFSAIYGFVFFIQSTVIGMHKVALWRLRIFNFDTWGYILKFNPSLTSMMEKFITKCLNLFNIASIS